MKITVYTITDCQFSKQEKDYLQSHQLAFEEKNLEVNREFLTEMLAVSNNFAGTPVSKIEKDDGQITVLKGFTKEDFDKALGFEEKTPPPPPAAEPVATPPPVVETPAAPPTPVTINEPKVETVPPIPETPPAPVAAPAPVIETPVAPAPVVQPAAPVVEPAAPAQPDPMANILNSLQQQANAAPVTPPPAPVVAMPTIPDPQL